MRFFALGLGLLLSAVSLASGSVSAQTDEWSKIVEAAKKEGEVIVWGGAGGAPLQAFAKDGFEKANPGIRVRWFAAPSADRDTRFLREFQAKVAKVDVLVGGSSNLVNRLLPAGALQPLRPMLRPDILDGRNWAGGEPFWSDAEKNYVIVSDQTVGPAVVTQKSISIKSWNDLLDPKYDKKLITTDPRAPSQSFAFLLFLYFSPDLGPDYVAKLFKNGRVVFAQEDSQALEWVDSGRMSIAFGVREPDIAAIEKVSAGNINILPTLEAAGVQQTIVAGAQGAAAVPKLDALPNPNAARVYLNWFYSKEGQQAMTAAMGLTSTRTDVDKSSLKPRLVPVAGAKYTSVNGAQYVSAEAAKASRDAVTRAIEGK